MNFGPANAPRFVDQTLKTRRLGGEFGVDFTLKLSDKWALLAGASGTVQNVRTNMNENDCESFAPPGLLTCTGILFATTQGDASVVDFVAGFRAGATYNGGWYRVVVSGFGAWDSHVPGIDNPK